MSEKRRKLSTRPDTTSESCDPSDSSQKSVAESTGPSFVSLKSDRSRMAPPIFGDEKSKCFQSATESASSVSTQCAKATHQQLSHLSGDVSTCSVCKKVLREPIQFACGHWSCKQCVSSNRDWSGSEAENPCPECVKKYQFKNGEDTGNILLVKAKTNLREAMKNKFTLTFEGNGDQENLLQSIYTTLFITTGEIEGLHEEHEFKSKWKKQSSQDSSVNLSDIFRPLSGHEKPHRTVLMKGVAGIGKSFAVQRFILDWAEEKANQDVDFVFSLAFKELNLITGEESLHELLTLFHPDLKDSVDYTKTRIVLILDGLDESRFQLDFEDIKMVTSVREAAPVGNLLANLIQGNLLPDANVWITSRPAAANQIPAEHVDMVTEIRGFNDPQKAEYFRRRFSDDPALAERIIKHIESSQSLDIMCQIPIFCWISAVLFQEVFGGDEETEIPQTLTEMMSHFLFAQIKRRNRKYDKTAETNKEKLLKTHREFLLKLGKLAFDQVLKNNLIFYEEDLEACGIDIKEASIYSGFCSTVFQEEKIFSQKKVFFFVHLTLQEFCAALYVYECFIKNETTELHSFLSLEEKEHTLVELLKMTVDKVLDNKNGHLDFFLRFLLGLMVEPNRRVLQGLLTPPDSRQDTDKKILTYIKSVRRKTLSPDNHINLFQTMVEMRDHKVKDEIQEYLKLSDHSKTELSPLHCSALAYMLQVSENDLDVLDLKSYNTTEEGRRRLIPAVRSSRKAILADCKVTSKWAEHLAFTLKFFYSSLRDLDLSNNDLKDLGVKLLCDGLSSQCCRLEALRLSGCLVTEMGCSYLASALQSNPTHLKELDLSYNHPGDAGEKQLTELKNDPRYKLSTLSFEHGGSHRMKPGLKKYACELTLDSSTADKKLRLSEENRKVTWVEDEPPHPDHKETFDHWQQVLCEQSLNGRYYWEVEVFGPLSVGVTFRRRDVKGKTNYFKMGHNDKSWCLVSSDGAFYIMHHNKKVEVPLAGWSTSRVGVYVDWPGGTLSFYRVSSDSCSLLHTYKTAFNEPLYPAVELHTQSSAVFCQVT
ncbi:NLR family CARD domain-containing protein 3-like [Archocentrus centrarchus]|uniref:NLR family CARD domain-containing protein 3-like n=1 Tax=Archocentrus centrarchus TaxID=63155 RepID=UPI0011E9C251|nr:NLR family CARD domain-containing protein 3-like [Archocentrus centrarchus]XP_030609205.1 NLR family CARD domain-containing protein 3-like [Archocentrus centrarchus]XP_030609206.1 NLR family CARD domain-containing protein 3-like [Archocentrus centrarchus]XP_030609207.1 NLR family CARD domain-containing protein 3-like [Archocentrus centrarchus]